MNDSKNRLIFNTRAQIEDSKRKGYSVIPKTVSNKEVVMVVNKKLSVKFFIDDISLSDLKGRWLRSGLVKYISFYDWLLKKEV